MKVLVAYAPGAKYDGFEGARLRKNIKGSLELNHSDWVESILFNPDLVTFFSPEDENKIKDYQTDGYCCLMYALASENDPKTRCLSYGENGIKLRTKAEKMLERADAIIVPNERCANIIKSQGITKPIYKHIPGVNLSRFEITDEIESSLVYRYLKINQSQKYSISVGNFEDVNAIKNARLIAENNKDTQFYVLGSLRTPGGLRISPRRISKGNPPNLKFLSVIPDDVFRSAIVHASCVTILGDSCLASMLALEALASKTPLFVNGDADNEIVFDKRNAYCDKDPIRLSRMMIEYQEGKLPSLVNEGYLTARDRTLTKSGAELIELFKGILNRRNSK